MPPDGACAQRQGKNLHHLSPLPGKVRKKDVKYRNSSRKAAVLDYPQSLAEFAAKAANKVKIVFGRGVYVDENTSQAASVEFVRQRRINYARSRLQNLAEKAEGLFRQIKTAAERLMSLS